MFRPIKFLPFLHLKRRTISQWTYWKIKNNWREIFAQLSYFFVPVSPLQFFIHLLRANAYAKEGRNKKREKANETLLSFQGKSREFSRIFKKNPRTGNSLHGERVCTCSLSLSLSEHLNSCRGKQACSWRKCVLMTSLVIRHADNCWRRESGGSLTVEHRLYPQLSRPLRFEARRDDSDRSFLEFRGCVPSSGATKEGGKVLWEKTAEMEKLPLDWTSAAFWITPPFGHCDLNGGSRETRKKIFRIEDFVSHNSPHKFYKVEQYPLRRENLNLSNV